MSLLIRNGEIVTAADKQVGDVLCEGGTIARVGRGLEAPPGAEIVDATGMYVFPGFIDPHVHVYLPLPNASTKDTYETASRAALVGGTTCFIDFVSPSRGQSPLETLDAWEKQARGRSACDYSFHMAVTGFDDAVAEELREVVRRGVNSFKVYLAYKETVGIGEDDLHRVLRFARALGVLTLAHCEDADEIERRQKDLLARGRKGPEWHYWSRPPEVEAAGTRRFLAAARQCGAPAYVVHLSCEEALKEALAARRAGARVWIETMIQYLLLDKSMAERRGFEGAKYVLSPPLRGEENLPVLWAALNSGEIDTVGTDHAPFDFDGQKTLGRDDFTRIPNGIPGIENRVNLLYTYGVAPGKIPLTRLVDVASTQPARIFGLYPRKGTIAPGSDADLVVYDPSYRGKISRATHLMNVDYNPYEGFEMRGRPHTVTVRGQVAVRGGRYVGTPGRGDFVVRRPCHF